MIRIYELSFGHNCKTDMTTILDHKTNTIIAEFDDYNVATYFVKKCFQYVGLNYKRYVKIDRKLFRPSKTRNLLADTLKARKDLNFKIKTNLDGLIKIMMDDELKKYNG